MDTEARNNKMNDVIALLKSVLISVKGSISLQQFKRDYYELVGSDIPYAQFGFGSLEDFLASNSKHFIVRRDAGQLFVDAKIDANTAHIASLIDRQKSSKPKGKKKYASHYRKPFQANRPNYNRPQKPQQLYRQVGKQNENRKPSNYNHKPGKTNRDTHSGTKAIAPNDARHKLTRLRSNPDARQADADSQKAQRNNSAPIQTKAINKSDEKRIKSEINVVRKNGSNRVKSPTSVINKQFDESDTKVVKNQGRGLRNRRESNGNNLQNLLRNIPQELLRETPLTSVTFEEILQRFLAKRRKNDGHGKWSFDSNNNDSSVTTNVGRGRGRRIEQYRSVAFDDDLIVAPKIAEEPWRQSLVNDSMSSFNDDNDDTVNLITVNRRVMVDRDNLSVTSSSPVSDVSVTPTIDVDSHDVRIKLKTLLSTLQINHESDVKISRCGRNYIASINFYTSQHDKSSLTTFPADYPTPEQAEMAAYELAFNSMQEQFAKLNTLPCTDERMVLPKIVELVTKSPAGIWFDHMNEAYIAAFNERLPDHWATIAKMSGDITIFEQSGKKMLIKSEEPTRLSNNRTVSPRAEQTTAHKLSIPHRDVPIDDKNSVSATVITAWSASNIYLRLNDSNLENLIDLMHVYYAKPINCTVPDRVEIGNFYATYCEETDLWYRVLAVDDASTSSDDGSASGDNVLFNFIDYGHDDQIATENLRVLPLFLYRIPRQVIKCSLISLEELNDLEDIAAPLFESLVGKKVHAQICMKTEWDDLETIYDVLLNESIDNDVININQSILEEITVKFHGPTIETEIINHMKVLQVEPDTTNGVFVYVTNESTLQNESTILDIFLDNAQNTINELAQTCDIYERDTSTINRESMFLYQHNDELFRCRIEQINPNGNQVIVRLIDHGRVVFVNLGKTDKRLIDLNRDAVLVSNLLPRIVPLCLRVQMYHNCDVIPRDVVAQLMGLIARNCNVMLELRDKTANFVELYQHLDGERVNLNERVGLLRLAEQKNQSLSRVTSPVQAKSPSPKKGASPSKSEGFPDDNTFPTTGDLPMPKIKAGDFFFVNIPTSVHPDNFFIQPFKTGNELRTTMKEIQRFYNDSARVKTPLRAQDIIEGRVYAAKRINDNVWYRTCIMKNLQKNRFSSFFVDFGEYVIVDLHDLAILDEQFRTLPCQAIKAKLHGIAPMGNNWSMEHCHRFQNLVSKKHFFATLHSVEQDVFNKHDIIASVTLVDTSGETDVSIHQLLADEKIAVIV